MEDNIQKKEENISENLPIKQEKNLKENIEENIKFKVIVKSTAGCKWCGTQLFPKF
jgi:hypothetical protein